MGKNPNLVIIHVGTNSLRGNTTPQQVANEIIEWTTRRDHVSEKVDKGNDILTTKTSTLCIGFIRHTNIK